MKDYDTILLESIIDELFHDDTDLLENEIEETIEDNELEAYFDSLFENEEDELVDIDNMLDNLFEEEEDVTDETFDLDIDFDELLNTDQALEEDTFDLDDRLHGLYEALNTLFEDEEVELEEDTFDLDDRLHGLYEELESLFEESDKEEAKEHETAEEEEEEKETGEEVIEDADSMLIKLKNFMSTKWQNIKKFFEKLFKEDSALGKLKGMIAKPYSAIATKIDQIKIKDLKEGQKSAGREFLKKHLNTIKKILKALWLGLLLGIVGMIFYGLAKAFGKKGMTEAEGSGEDTLVSKTKKYISSLFDSFVKKAKAFFEKRTVIALLSFGLGMVSGILAMYNKRANPTLAAAEAKQLLTKGVTR